MSSTTTVMRTCGFSQKNYSNGKVVAKQAHTISLLIPSFTSPCAQHSRRELAGSDSAFKQCERSLTSLPMLLTHVQESSSKVLYASYLKNMLVRCRTHSVCFEVQCDVCLYHGAHAFDLDTRTMCYGLHESSSSSV